MAKGSKSKGMLSGLTNKSASSSDKSTNLKMSPTVDSGASRGAATAATPETLGPRTA